MPLEIVLGPSTSPLVAAAIFAQAEHSNVELRQIEELPQMLKHFRRFGPVLVTPNKTVVFGADPIVRYLAGASAPKFTLVETKRMLSTIAFNQPIESEDARLATKHFNARCSPSISSTLSSLFREATVSAFPEHEEALNAIALEATESQMKGVDYQFNATMNVFAKLKTLPNFPCKTPNQAAQAIANQLDRKAVSWLISSVSVPPNTFYINIALSDELLATRVAACASTPSGADVAPPAIIKRERVVVDFSSPNIAKEMHVGHLRSTIIGDTLCRFYEFAGHEVLRVNHVGDWGTQFGMLLLHLDRLQAETKIPTLEYLKTLSLTQLTQLYAEAKKRFEADPQFKTESREMVVRLQSGNEKHLVDVWQALVSVSRVGFEEIYTQLNVKFPDHPNLPGVGYCGESFYNDKIPAVLEELKSKKITTTLSNGAVVIFTGLKEAQSAYQSKADKDAAPIPSAEAPAETEEETTTVDDVGDKKEVPLMIIKSDGGIGYDSTDMAAVKFRLITLKADRVLYVTDSGQSMHFNMVFEAARLVGWAQPHQKLHHIKFGVVTAVGGGRFRSRDGDTVRLSDLLNDARVSMLNILEEKIAANPDEATARFGYFPTKEKFRAHLERLAADTGYSAVKYADLRTNRERDYEFDSERMLSPDGDTAVYLMYAYARLASVVAKAEASLGKIPAEPGEYNPAGASESERKLALRVVRFQDVFENALTTLAPHQLCIYLYQLCSETSSFLTAANERILIKVNPTGDAWMFEPGRGKQRLHLVRAAHAVLGTGMRLVGIQPYERM